MNYSTHNQQAAQLYHNPDTFRSAMAEAGLFIDETIIADGEIHRFKPDGDRNRNGWYICFGDGGAFGNWKTGFSATWTTGRRTDADEHARIIEACKAQKRKRDAGYLKAKNRAQQLWRDALLAVDHPYLIRKGVHSHGLRILNNQLLIPVTVDKVIQSLQFIDPDGGKRFLKGGRATGGYYPIGQPKQRIWLAEGYATAASVHQATGDTVVTAFNCGNLKKVLAHMVRTFPESQFFIAADNDEAGTREADQALNKGASGSIAPAVEPGVTDWNDHAQKHGLKETRAVLREAF